MNELNVGMGVAHPADVEIGKRNQKTAQYLSYWGFSSSHVLSRNKQQVFIVSEQLVKRRSPSKEVKPEGEMSAAR